MEGLIKLKQEKLAIPYQVKTIGSSTKDVSESSRTASGMFNSFNYIDSDQDMLIAGAASKSILERGVGTTAGNKIKHLKDHVWANNIARLDVLDERTVQINGKSVTGIYHESFYPKATDSDDMLKKIKAGLYDDRSIGFQYINLGIAAKDSEDKDERILWDKYYPLALNPEKADEHGFFYVVKEIKLFEGSDVAFGANELTPFLGMKNKGEQDSLQADLFAKLDIMSNLFKSGNLTDEGFQQLEMEKLQIKSYISAIMATEPSKKSTIIENSRQIPDTQTKFYKKILTSF